MTGIDPNKKDSLLSQTAEDLSSVFTLELNGSHCSGKGNLKEQVYNFQ